MKKEILTPWNISDVDNKTVFYVEAIHDDYEGFRVLLSSDILSGKMLRITFNNYLSYRNTNESYLLKMWSNNNDEILKNTFFLVLNSEYIDFFHKYTLGVHNDMKVVHYAIYTTQDCIEILADEPPKVEWLN